MTPQQVIMAATQNASKILSLDPQVGTVEVGKMADLIIVRQNPLIDVRHLQDIDFVIRAGKSINVNPNSL